MCGRREVQLFHDRNASLFQVIIWKIKELSMSQIIYFSFCIMVRCLLEAVNRYIHIYGFYILKKRPQHRPAMWEMVRSEWR